MSAVGASRLELGATPIETRALAPDLARGGMLLLIALANVRVYLHGHSLSVRGYPRDVEGVNRVIASVELMLIDGRAYPLFGLLFGYGIVQLARRRTAVGLPATTLTRLVRRRGWWMLAIGFTHGALLWAGDIIGAYGLIAVLMAGMIVTGTDRRLLITAAVGALFTTLAYAGSGVPQSSDPQSLLPSMSMPSPATAALSRITEWAGIGLVVQALSVFGAVALGAWAARQRLLDQPHHYRRLLTRAALAGTATAILGGLPLALIAAQAWTSPPVAAGLLAAALHSLSGYAGGIGYAAVFGLIAIRLTARETQSRPVQALVACGQRSLSCYLAQSVVFATLLPAWALGLGARLDLAQAALIGLGTWAVILLTAWASAQAGYRGPAEVLLRRLTYGPQPVQMTRRSPA